jgi:hypothetical protein
MAMSDRDKAEALSDGVYGWMGNHPLSTHDAISDGAARGLRAWLDANAAEFVDIIAKKVADRIAADYPPEETP